MKKFFIFIFIALIFSPVNAKAAPPEGWCYTFNKNLKKGDRGEEVKALQTAVNVVSLARAKDEVEKSLYGPVTSDLVLSFKMGQLNTIFAENYRLSGDLVDAQTRAWLNALYACEHYACNFSEKQCALARGSGKNECSKASDCVQPSLVLKSPNGGETLKPGASFVIKWSAKKINNISKITIQTSDSPDFLSGAIAEEVIFDYQSVVGNLGPDTKPMPGRVPNASAGSWSWKVPKESEFRFLKYNKMTIFGASSYGATGELSDSSDSSFSVSSKKLEPATPVNTEQSIMVTSPNGGEQWQKESKNEITWTSSGVDKVYIYRYVYNPAGKLTNKFLLTSNGIKASEGKFTWKNAVEGKSKIFISSQKNGKGVSDISDDYFNITAKKKASFNLLLKSVSAAFAGIAEKLEFLFR